MRILFNNLIDDGDISSTDESLNYPATNISHPFLKKRFQSTSTTSTITILFGSDQSINCLFYGEHNLTSLTIRLKDSGGVTLLTINVTGPTDRGREYFEQYDNVRSVELDLVGPDPVKLGGVGLGVYYQNLNFLSGYPQSGRITGRISKSPSGQTLVNRVKPLRTYSFTFRDREKDGKDEWLENIDNYAPGPLWMDLTECDIDFLEVIYASINGYPGAIRNGRRYDNALSIEEAR